MRFAESTVVATAILAGFFILGGCSSKPASTSPPVTSGPSQEGKQYLLTGEPQDARDVIAMRSSVKDGQDVVVVGRIGGSDEPFVEDVAAFTIVDRSLQACSDVPGDNCPTPWDYCCRTDALPEASVLVKVVDESGSLIPVGARELLGLGYLQTVVVQGTARRDEAGNVTVLASALHVRDDGGKGYAPALGGHDDGDGHDHNHAGDDHHHNHDEPHNVDHDHSN